MAKKRKNEKFDISESQIVRALMEHSTDSIYFKDLKSRFVLINKALAERLGIKDPDEAVGKTDFDFFTEEHAKQAYNKTRGRFVCHISSGDGSPGSLIQ